MKKLQSMIVRRQIIAIFLGLALAGGIGAPAFSQEPGTEALGTPIGTFIAYPSLTLGTEYNDNIFATDNNTEDDFIFRIRPELRIESDWVNHSLGFLASGDLARYADNTNEDTNGWRFLSDGRIDILRDTYATLNAGIAQTFEERGSADDVNGDEPTKELTYGGGAGFFHRISRTWLELEGSVAKRDFSDVDSVDGLEINNDDRNRIEYRTTQKFGYDVNPEIAAFLQTTFNRTDYDDTTDDFGDSRDSFDYSLSAGLRLDVTDLIFGDVFAGITRREYDGSDFDDQTTWSVGGKLTWLVTELTSASLNASRSWQETTVAGSSAALTTTAGVSVSHSLLDTVSLDAFFDYTHEDFEETDRIDHTYSTGPGITYLMNRFLHWGLNYTYTQRQSDAPGQDYIENLVLLTARLQY